jgi:hypothetical protein
VLKEVLEVAGTKLVDVVRLQAQYGSTRSVHPPPMQELQLLAAVPNAMAACTGKQATCLAPVLLGFPE